MMLEMMEGTKRRRVTQWFRAWGLERGDRTCILHALAFDQASHFSFLSSSYSIATVENNHTELCDSTCHRTGNRLTIVTSAPSMTISRVIYALFVVRTVTESQSLMSRVNPVCVSLCVCVCADENFTYLTSPHAQTHTCVLSITSVISR